MRGYWNLPEQQCARVSERRAGPQVVPHRRHRHRGHGPGYRYVSRRDRMVKRRGYRVELGEIEVGLLKHPDIREAAVVAVADAESGVRVTAFVAASRARR